MSESQRPGGSVPYEIDRLVARIEDALLGLTGPIGRAGEAEIMLEQVRAWARELASRSGAGGSG
jgi:hypothetical protein